MAVWIVRHHFPVPLSQESLVCKKSICVQRLQQKGHGSWHNHGPQALAAGSAQHAPRAMSWQSVHEQNRLARVHEGLQRFGQQLPYLQHRVRVHPAAASPPDVDVGAHSRAHIVHISDTEHVFRAYDDLRQQRLNGRIVAYHCDMRHHHPLLFSRGVLGDRPDLDSSLLMRRVRLQTSARSVMEFYCRLV